MQNGDLIYQFAAFEEFKENLRNFSDFFPVNEPSYTLEFLQEQAQKHKIDPFKLYQESVFIGLMSILHKYAKTQKGE